MIDLRAVSTKAAELDNDLVKVQRELKRVASVKCRLKKMPNHASYQDDLTAVLQEEDLLKSVREFINGPRKNVSTITQEEISLLTLDETMRALKAIQSKKTHTKWLTTVPGDNDDYREACKIEEALKAHRDAIAPRTNGYISAKDLQALLDTLGGCNDLSKQDCVDRLRKFIEED